MRLMNDTTILQNCRSYWKTVGQIQSCLISTHCQSLSSFFMKVLIKMRKAQYSIIFVILWSLRQNIQHCNLLHCLFMLYCEWLRLVCHKIVLSLQTVIVHIAHDKLWSSIVVLLLLQTCNDLQAIWKRSKYFPLVLILQHIKHGLSQCTWLNLHRIINSKFSPLRFTNAEQTYRPCYVWDVDKIAWYSVSWLENVGLFYWWRPLHDWLHCSKKLLLAWIALLHQSLFYYNVTLIS